MQPPIDGSVTLITGASSGIGRAFAVELARRVKTLVLVARRTERLEELAQQLRAAYGITVDVQSCDLTDRAATDAMVQSVEAAHGGVDVLINNAGRGDFAVYDLSPWQNTESLLELNIRALSYLCRRLGEPMAKRGKGAILNVSSGAAFMVFPGMAAYVASKHYVSAFSEMLALELRPAGVVVSHVCPGPIDTEFMENSGADPDSMPPAFLMLSAEACARATMREFGRGKTVILPGLVNKLTVWIGGLMPTALLRIALRGFAAGLRTKALDAGDESAPAPR